MNRKHYNESDRLALLREYYSSGLSKYAFVKKHNLSGSAILNKWIKKYSSPQKELPLEKSLLKRLSSEGETEMANRSKESYREENAQLKKRIKELEKSLSFSRLETEARDLMITRAEEYFNIQIRKKSGAK